MGKLILVRHGHTSLNKPGEDERLRAWLDVPLDETGLQEAVETAEKLHGYPIEAIYCSDLKRARQTAQVLKRKVKARITATPELRPWNLGVFGGEKIKDILPFLNMLNERTDLAAPSGESFDQFYGRYSVRLQQLMTLADSTEGYVLAVTHVRNLLAATVIVQGGEKSEVPVCGGPSTGAITFVERVDGNWTIRRDDGRPVVQSADGRNGETHLVMERRTPAIRNGAGQRRRSIRATA
ncbi:MAG TPA: histidine phosphatase family protein [Terriglobales bacterium]|nr:histidine phosphatase family protein [Terriglobales bacterium]